MTTLIIGQWDNSHTLGIQHIENVCAGVGGDGGGMVKVNHFTVHVCGEV